MGEKVEETVASRQESELSISYENYIEFMEMFSVLHEKVGKSQRLFNALMWQNGRLGNIPVDGNVNHRNNFVTNVDLDVSFLRVEEALKVMRESVYRPMAKERG